MATLGSSKTTPIGICKQKHADLVAEELKRLVTQRNLKPGDKLPQEIKLQETFGVSKGTTREALKLLEVQGLVSVSTRPAGGGIIVEMPLDHTSQLIQSYPFFKGIDIADVYTAHHPLEPGLAAGAVSHLVEDDFHAFEHTIDLCSLASAKTVALLDQCQEDLDFHDILVVANPNPILWFCCELINEAIRQPVVFGDETSPRDHAEFGTSNMKFHRQILNTVRARDADIMCTLMGMHMDDYTHHVICMEGRVYGRLVLDSGMPCRHRPLIDGYDDDGHDGHNEGRM